MALLLNLGICATQALNVLLGGEPDEALSSRAWRLRFTRKRWAAAVHLIDALFFWQDEHCHNAYLSELYRQQVPPELRLEKT